MRKRKDFDEEDSINELDDDKELNFDDFEEFDDFEDFEDDIYNKFENELERAKREKKEKRKEFYVKGSELKEEIRKYQESKKNSPDRKR